MKKINFILLFFILYSFILPTFSASASENFYVLPLGTSGGELEDNLSSYLVAPITSSDGWIALDAGTLCSSIKKIPTSIFKKLKIEPISAENFFTQWIRAYLLSHAHLDHISGLVMCSTIDKHKEILGIDSTINYLRDNIFNWKIWPNFSDEGENPLLKQYHYQRLKIGTFTPIAKTTMQVKSFILNHGNHYPSTAFLLENHGKYLLYFGDTGADQIEQSHDIQTIWQEIVPLIRTHQLKAIFIESSYANNRPDNMLFGHLNPRWLLIELRALANLVNPEHPELALQGIKIIVTHIKQGLENKSMSEQILKELNHENTLGVKFIIPKARELLLL